MDIIKVVQKRKSIRAFKPDPVPREILERIMETALRAPSWGNTQPWSFTMASGKPLEMIKKECSKFYQEGVKPSPDLVVPVKWNKTRTTRYEGLGRGLFKALGIGRGDKEKRGQYYERMAAGFGAPHSIFLHLEAGDNQYAMLDAGLILQTISLLAVGEGLGTCFITIPVLYPDIVRKYIPLSKGKTLVTNLAIGYPVQDAPENLFQSKRGNPGEFIQWVNE